MSNRNWCDDTCDLFEAQRDAALAVLRRLEWSERREAIGFVYNCCPFCGNDKDKGHAADCDLAAALKPARPAGVEK